LLQSSFLVSTSEQGGPLAEVGCRSLALPSALATPSSIGHSPHDSAPTIIPDTGMTPQNFTDGASLPLPFSYTIAPPVWVSFLDFVGLTGPAWCGRSLSGTAPPQALARARALCRFAAPARPCSASAKARRFPRRTADGAVSLCPAATSAPAPFALSVHVGTLGAVLMQLPAWPARPSGTGGASHSWPRRASAPRAAHLAGSDRPSAVPAERSRPDRESSCRISLGVRVLGVMFSYALPAISPGPVLTILVAVSHGRLKLTQCRSQPAGVESRPLPGASLFLWGFGRPTATPVDNRRPIGLFSAVLTPVAPRVSHRGPPHVSIAIALISFSTFLVRRVPDVAVEGRSYAFPRDGQRLMTGIARFRGRS